MSGVVTYLNDKLQNLVSGLNTGRDKQFHNQWVMSQLNQRDLETAYRGDWLVRKIIDIPPFDMVREWRDWKADNDVIEKLEHCEREYCIPQKVQRALTLARLYGGAVIVMGVDGTGSPESELDLERVTEESISYLHVLHRYEITTGDINRNVLDPLYGEPTYYEVANQDMQARVHPSRVIRFVVNPLPDNRNVNEGWGDPVLQAIQESVLQAGSVTSNIASMTHEANVDVIRIPNFMESLATAAYTSKLVQRFTLAATAKGNNGMLLLDKDEEYDRKELHFAALPDILDRFMQIVSGAADIPATRLLSQSPAGMNATGESDIRNYYDRLSADQRLCLDPALNKLTEVLIRSATGSRDEDIYYEWAPLWQMSDVEKADNAKKRAETSQIYANSGLVPTDALAVATVNQLVEDGTYPGLETAIAEAETDPAEFALSEKQAEADMAQKELDIKANQPPPGANGSDPRKTTTQDDWSRFYK